MKKTLIALAVLGAAGVAHAQTNVTIYGQLQPSYDYVTVKNADGSGKVKTTNMSYNASRVGFLGSEDLGNGLKAKFKLEHEFDLVADKGWSAGGLSRDTWVGLAGGFGEVQFGNINSVYKQVSASYDPMEDSVGDYNSIMGMLGDNGDANRRYKRTVNYYSPVFSGFQVMGNYALVNADVDTAPDSKAWSLAAVYNNGPLNVFAAYDKQNKVDGGLAMPDVSFWKVGAAYKFPFGTTIRGIYERAKADTVGHSNHWLLGAEHKINNITLMANYIKAGDIGGVGDSGAKAFNIGVQYDLSKRTNILGVYGYLKNDSALGIYSDDAGYGDLGQKVSAFSVRLQHKF